MTASILFSIGAGLLLLIGLIGAFVPVLPGPPLAWAGLLLSFFSKYNNISIAALIITGIIAVIVTVLDNVFPVLMTKKGGGSKAATTGSTIGLIVGFFLGPVGLILGPFLGAFIGELISSHGNMDTAFKSAWAAFMGFLCGTGAKLVVVLVYIWIYIASFFSA